MEKLILHLFHSSAVGFYSLGFTHSLSPYLQTCWANPVLLWAPFSVSHLCSPQLQTGEGSGTWFCRLNPSL